MKYIFGLKPNINKIMKATHRKIVQDEISHFLIKHLPICEQKDLCIAPQTAATIFGLNSKLGGVFHTI